MTYQGPIQGKRAKFAKVSSIILDLNKSITFIISRRYNTINVANLVSVLEFILKESVEDVSTPHCFRSTHAAIMTRLISNYPEELYPNLEVQ